MTLKAIINGTLFLNGEFVENRVLLFDRHIRGTAACAPEGAQVYDAGGGMVSAGLIDVHCHGFGGREAGEATAEELLEMCRTLVGHGVTAWLPTVSCLPKDRYRDCFDQIRTARRQTEKPGFRGARILGAHAEGPFLSPQKCGAQNIACILPPDWTMVEPFLPEIRMITVAPEMEGALPLIRRLADAGITVSAGHTNANYAQTVAGIDAGITHATHLFNAMPSLVSRNPGPVTALLNDHRVYCELIADGFHVHPALLALTARLKGDRLVLVTDSIRFAGLPDGTYTLSGQTVTVHGPECLLPGGTIAGSTLTLDRAVRNAHDMGGMATTQALFAATAGAAASIGEHTRGTLADGNEADIAVFDRQMQPTRTFVSGEEVWKAQ